MEVGSELADIFEEVGYEFTCFFRFDLLDDVKLVVYFFFFLEASQFEL